MQLPVTAASHTVPGRSRKPPIDDDACVPKSILQSKSFNAPVTDMLLTEP